MQFWMKPLLVQQTKIRALDPTGPHEPPPKPVKSLPPRRCTAIACCAVPIATLDAVAG